LAELGEILLDREASRDLVRYHREEVDVSLDHDGFRFIVTRAVRERVELYNEQISLLVNGEGARLLREHPNPDIEPIYRIHPAPDPERLASLRTTIRALARHHGLGERFVWQEGASLARYIAALPEPPRGAMPAQGETRIARALERQAIVANMRSYYAGDPGQHYGVGLDPYGRFTAPMREIVGVFLHGEVIEAFGLGASSTPRDPALRDAVVTAGNRSRDLQRKISDAGNRLVIDRVLRSDLSKARSDRPRRRGTVMGIAGSKVHVSLDDPPLDLKIYLRELGRVLGGAWLKPSDDGVSLLKEKTGEVVFSVGDAIDLTTVELDGATDRWVLSPERVVP
jgi:ribonuclease R